MPHQFARVTCPACSSFPFVPILQFFRYPRESRFEQNTEPRFWECQQNQLDKRIGRSGTVLIWTQDVLKGAVHEKRNCVAVDCPSIRMRVSCRPSEVAATQIRSSHPIRSNIHNSS